MHRSSESVAALAGALARAQAELVNPEKSLVGIVGSERRGEVERSFRYAPLSSGLDIVRKTLSKHEIAAIQTTAIDAATGTVHLTTMLAHASGEWIASDWPVCAVADTATPRRMGAALTYARRYSLFTLVGIAGEDDVDAPDLHDGANPQQNFPDAIVDVDRAQKRRNGKAAVPIRPTLSADQSAELSKRLLVEIADLNSTEDATIWACRTLGVKNSLTAIDAQQVEQAFQSRAMSFENRIEEKQTSLSSASMEHADIQPLGDEARRTIDKGALSLGEPRRYRNKLHLKFVALQPCLICGRCPSDAHHLRFMQRRAIGRKVSDEFAVPLCRTHHREVHRCGDERAWWKTTKINAGKAARNLWRVTRLSKAAISEDLATGAAS